MKDRGESPVLVPRRLVQPEVIAPDPTIDWYDGIFNALEKSFLTLRLCAFA